MNTTGCIFNTTNNLNLINISRPSATKEMKTKVVSSSYKKNKSANNILDNKINRSSRSNKNNKRHLFFRTPLVQTVSIVLLALTILICSIITVNANISKPQKDKIYSTISIESGDSLWSIAKKYCTNDFDDYNSFIEEVKNINSLYNDTIKSGGYIVIPRYVD